MVKSTPGLSKGRGLRVLVIDGDTTVDALAVEDCCHGEEIEGAPETLPKRDGTGEAKGLVVA